MNKWVTVHASNGDELWLNLSYIAGVCVNQKYVWDNNGKILRLLSFEDAENVQKAIMEE